ncbi:DUF892 family protein [Histidinibacterium aquaticum]|uniref:Ferritin-like domain-containing protein n=1 Tax=Histidinibacterium aquaticum TaxID=2613962 RepID=A0A5J5GG67_9RHOB|nr:ferritin-like domain-containing protein [Histidinibacterium aquaticum]KAA9007077.1 ferritin-like domain-containing protein [Histidinibacterium aquaticum]
MVTTVGNETGTADLVQNLLRLEYDAIAAYDATLERLDDDGAKSAIADFRGDHTRHVDELKSIATRHGIDVPSESDMKSLLTTGKVAMANLAGDKSVLKAMKTNEDDTVQAYRQAASNSEADPEMKRVFEAAQADEERHRAWMESHSH